MMLLTITGAKATTTRFDLSSFTPYGGQGSWNSSTSTFTVTSDWGGGQLWNETSLADYGALVVKVKSAEAKYQINIYSFTSTEKSSSTTITANIPASTEEQTIVLPLDENKERFYKFELKLNTTLEDAGGASSYSIVLNGAYLTTSDVQLSSLISSDMNALYPDKIEGTATGLTTYSNKTITMGTFSDDSWGSAAWWLAGWDSEKSVSVPVDYSAYDKVVIRFASATTSNGGAGIGYGSGYDTYENFEAGAKEVVLTLDSERKNSVTKVYISGPQNATYSLADAYVTTYTYNSLSEDITPELKTVSNAYVDLTRTFTSGWNSVCLPFATTATELGCKAYEFTSATSTSVTFTEIESLTAGTPYLLYFESAPSSNNYIFTNENISVTTPSSVTKDEVTFTGTFVNATDGDGKFGVLSSGDIMVGGSGSNFKGYRAYFTGLSSTSSESRLLIITNDITAINNVEEAHKSQNDDVIYTLSGVKVYGQPTKGIYIKNGKKFVIK